VLVALIALSQSQVQPVQVVPGSLAQRADQPQLAVGRDGRVWLAFGAGESIYVCMSKDNGRTFSSPVVVNATPVKTPLGMRRGPRIAANKSRVVVTAVVGAQGAGKDGDLVAWRSSDGQEWDGPEKVSDVPGSAREGLHAMGAGMDDAFVAVWLDLRAKGTKLYGSFSSNGGRSWSENKIAYESPETTICECCHPSLGFGPFGEVAAMFRNSLRGARDMFVATSPDGGRSWGMSAKIGTQTWEIGACPMDGGALGFDGAGALVSVWRSGEKIYLGRGVASTELAVGKNPWLAMAGSTAHVVWQSGNGIYYQSRTNTASRSRLAESGKDPVIVNTKDGPLAAWRQAGSQPGIYVVKLAARAGQSDETLFSTAGVH
jgi:hypothetical protein